MDPMLLFAVASAGGEILKGRANQAQAMEAAAQQELNAKLADTQALQRDTLAREDLAVSESATRAARGANGLSLTSPTGMALFEERQRVADRDRLVQRADDRQRAANFRTAARSSRNRARYSMINGFVNAGSSLLDYGNVQFGGR